MNVAPQITEVIRNNSFIFSLPVATTDIHEFCEQVRLLVLSEKISNFVTKQLVDMGMKKEVLRFFIHEMIKNSFDSFISSGVIEPGSALVFSAVVKRNEENIIIKFKDNGKGIDREGKFFTVNDLKSSKRCFNGVKKGVHAHFGGNGVALRQTQQSIQRQGGTMKLKNRKIAGCSVYINFKVE